MYPLIEIKTVPIEIEVKTSRAQLEYARGTAEMEISRDKGSVSIKSRPIRLSVDRFESRNQGQMPRSSASTNQAQNFATVVGQKATYEATATYANQNGQLLVDARIGQQSTAAQVQAISAQSDTPVTDHPVDGEMHIRYEMDKLNFDWRTGNVEFTFEPGDIEFSIIQQPDLIIQYVGGPLYVPPSADPDYEPIDVQA